MEDKILEIVPVIVDALRIDEQVNQDSCLPEVIP